MSDKMEIRDIESLEALKTLFIRFSKSASSILKSIEEKINQEYRGFQAQEEQLHKEVKDAEFSYDVARSALSRCKASGYKDENGNYVNPDCSYESQDVHIKSIKLQQIRDRYYECRRVVSFARDQINIFSISKRKFEELIYSHNNEAIKGLQYILDRADDYIHFLHSVSSSSTISSSVMESDTFTSKSSDSYSTKSNSSKPLKKQIEDTFANFDDRFFNDEIQKRQGSAQAVSSIDPSLIMPVEIDKDFWSHHLNNKERYLELVKNYDKAVKIVNSGGSLDEYPVLANAYHIFNISQPIKLDELNGFYRVDAGRHRVTAAQELGINIEAEVTHYKEVK